MPSDNTRSTNSSTHMAQKGQMPSVPLKDLADISVGDERTSISRQMEKMLLTYKL